MFCEGIGDLRDVRCHWARLYTYAADSRAGRTEDGATLPWILALLLGGFSIRGPMDIVTLVGVVCSYYALTNQ